MATSTPVVTTPPANDARVNFVHSSEVSRIVLDGKEYKITRIRVLLNDKWQNVDLDKYGPQELEDLAKACQKIHGKLGGNTAKTLTFHFEQKSVEQPFTARFSDKYRVTPSLQFKKLETKTSDGKTEIQALENFSGPVQLAVQRTVKKIETQTERFFANPKNYLKLQEGNPGPKKAITQKNENAAAQSIAALTLNVQDAGGKDMRCAARSVAAILLSKNNNDFKAACKEANIAEPSVKEDPIGAIAEALTQRAAKIIQSDPTFVDPNNPRYSNIVAALDAADQTVRAEEVPKAAVQRYAELIQAKGQMLDAPFFDALDVDQKSFITLIADNGVYKIRRTSENISFDQKIEENSLENIYFVIYVNQDHYQAIIRNENVAQLNLLREIITTSMNDELLILRQTVEQMKLTPEDNRKNYNNIEPKIKHLMERYPADAKEKIIDILKTKNGGLNIEGLKANGFTAAVVNAFLTTSTKLEVAD